MITKFTSLKNYQGFIKYFKNTLWFFSEKILGMLIGLFVGVWVARYLGPEQFGMFSYVGAFVSLFVPLGKLGFDGIVSRNIARDEMGHEVLINSSIAFKFIGSSIIISLVSIYTFFFKEDILYFYLSLAFSLIYLIKSFEIIEFFYRAKVKAKFISIANSIGLVVSSLLKITLILSSSTLIYFATANVIRAVIVTAILIYFFSKEDIKLSFKSVEFKKGLELLKESWPLIFSGFFALIYLNIDQVMIEEMLSAYEVGQYSAAVRISSLWYFIPLTIGWSIQTAIVNAKKHSQKLYYERLQIAFTVMALLAYLFIVPISFFANNIIDLLFGSAYFMAGEVLALHIIALLFVFVGSVRGLWVTNESHFKFALMSNVSAGILNIVLNYIWIQKYGIIGAAWATLFSYFVTYVGTGFFFVPARKILVMQLKAIFLIETISLYKNIGKK
ncbi:Flippase [Candidatus Magnetomoraceae bacterium gMMP-1]